MSTVVDNKKVDRIQAKSQRIHSSLICPWLETRKLKPMKTGNHAAFSRTRRALGMSLPGAPNKRVHQLPRSEKINVSPYRVQSLSIRGGNVSVGGE